MIPAYSEEVKITVIETPASDKPLEEQVKLLQEQVNHLMQTVDYINRERSRMKTEIDSLRNQMNRG